MSSEKIGDFDGEAPDVEKHLRFYAAVLFIFRFKKKVLRKKAFLYGRFPVKWNYLSV